MTKTTFGSQPESIQYMPLPGTDMADVWLRKNITCRFNPALHYISSTIYKQ